MPKPQLSPGGNRIIPEDPKEGPTAGQAAHRLALELFKSCPTLMIIGCHGAFEEYPLGGYAQRIVELHLQPAQATALRNALRAGRQAQDKLAKLGRA